LKDDWVKPEDFKKIEKHALEEMLAARRHPELTFVSRRIRRDGANEFQVEGDLTIRGLTKPAVVRLRLEVQAGGVLLFQGGSTIRLKDYGLKPPSAALGLIGTKDEMDVTFHLQARPES
jgi:polyisoprenoid-binding protein YceI